MNERAAADQPRRARQSASSSQRRRLLQYGLVFVGVVLILNALAGERGLVETMRVRRQYADLEQRIATLRWQNARLRDEARRLREDPRTIEEAARKDLGLMRGDEVLFVIKDVPAGQQASAAR